MSGPLSGVRIVEFAGIGPAPFAGMMLADAGADIVRIDRHDKATYPPQEKPHLDLMNRGRRSVAVDLKNSDGVELALRLIDQADGLMEGFRPGVAERLGLGPDVCLKRNPRLVYGRMTGWGQTGPLSTTAGHDIDYISVAGALEAIGRAGQPPLPPLNLIGDFGGGGMLLAFGMVSALLSAQKTGEGQVIDAAMVDGAAALMTMIHTFRAMGIWKDVRGTNLLDTGAHFYEVYETSDGKFMSVGAIEPQFYAELIRLLGLDSDDLPDQNDKTQWPTLKERFAALFLTKTRDQWQAIFDGSDACVSPVLSIPEAAKHPHNQYRGTFTEVAGVVQPGPAPRFGGTPSSIRRPPPNPGQHGDEALVDWGIEPEEIAKMRSAGAIT
jgi:alpha-methylacyl-CoA racemase